MNVTVSRRSWLVSLALALLLAGILGLIASRPSSAPPPPSDLAKLPGLPQDAPLVGETPSLSEMDAARARNNAVPYAKGPITPAPPFVFSGSAQDRLRASECLALAAMAEAGPSDTGQRAVIQVILNRVRHPAFAKTICGVVFEGSERVTGCQFTFTCDGSLARRYSESAWLQARIRAGEALGGYVFKPVGLSTHYHTDWVYPYWSPELDKLAKIETHLFFRWPGYWGTKAAFASSYRGNEPDPARLFGAAFADTAAVVPPPAAVPDAPKIEVGTVVMRATGGKANFILLGSPSTADALSAARAVCNQPGTCRVLGWSDAAALPKSFPVPQAARAVLQFSYTRDPAGAEIVLYGCSYFSNVPRDQCIPRAR